MLQIMAKGVVVFEQILPKRDSPYSRALQLVILPRHLAAAASLSSFKWTWPRPAFSSNLLKLGSEAHLRVEYKERVLTDLEMFF
jgi:hypothetical protein